MDNSWFGKFLNKVGQTYGQVDKNVFGGLLPGGAATPIGSIMPRYQQGTIVPGFQDKSPTSRLVSAIPSALNAVANPGGTLGLAAAAKQWPNLINVPGNENAKPAFVPGPSAFLKLPKGFKPTIGADPVTLKTSELIDAAASGVAAAQPFISNTLNNAPQFVQQSVESGLNKLPISANLFLRYYTGLKDKGLELPKDFTNQISSGIEQSQKNLPYTKQIVSSNVKELSSELNNINDALKSGQNYEIKQIGPLGPGMSMGVGKSIGGSALQSFRNRINNQLAEAKSNQNTLNQGGIPVIPYGTGSNNPMSSISTSLGRAVFYPKPGGGYGTNETYDFFYGNADKKTGPDVLFTPTGDRIRLDFSNSQNMAQAVATSLLNPGLKSDATMATPTNFGRAIVSKLPELNYNYNINIPAP